METSSRPKEAIARRIEAYRVDKGFVRQGEALKQNPQARDIIREGIQRQTRLGMVEGEEGESVAAYIGIGREVGFITDEESGQFLAVAHKVKAEMLRQKAEVMPHFSDYFSSQAKHHDRRAALLLNSFEEQKPQVTTELATKQEDNKTVVSQPVETRDQGNELQEVVDSVIDITVAGKFPNGAYFMRKGVNGQTEQAWIQSPNGGNDDYTSGGWKNIPLAQAMRLEGINLNILQSAVRQEFYNSEVNKNEPKVGRDYVYITDFKPDQNYLAKYPDAAQYSDGTYSVVDYAFLQAGGDRTNRPLDFVNMVTLMPREQAKKLEALIKENPHRIQDFYQALVPGLEGESEVGKGIPLVRKVPAQELILLDIPTLPLPFDKLSDMFEGNAANTLHPLLSLLDKAGKIPHFPYNGVQVQAGSDQQREQLMEQFKNEVLRVSQEREERDRRKQQELTPVAPEPKKHWWSRF